MLTVEEIINRLQLKPHPEEGGYFRETYRAAELIPQNTLSTRYFGPRHYSTAIYYLLTSETKSYLHLVASDEVFHFYLGDPVTMLRLYPDGSSETMTFGSDIVHGQILQSMVPAGVWQGSFLKEGGKFALFGCTVAPGFDLADYENGNREKLIQEFPEQKDLIMVLTK